MLAITTTIRGVDKNFEDWLKCYINLGADRFYIFLDAPAEDFEFVKNLQSKYPGLISLQLHNEALRERYTKISEFKDFQADIDRMVVYRQCLNTNIALESAVADYVDWLVHVDSDELIAFPQMHRSLKEFLEKLPQEIDSYIFPSMEAIPEELEPNYCFQDVKWFKLSPYLLSFHQLDRLMHGWRERGGKFPLFNAHIQGKSAFRVSNFNEAFTPYSVHEFVPYRWSSTSVRVSQTLSEPFLFHFPFIGLSAFKKRFSGFNANRINTYDRGVFNYNFYEDVVKRLAEGEEVLSIYEQRIMCLDDYEYLKEYGYLIELNFRERL